MPPHRTHRTHWSRPRARLLRLRTIVVSLLPLLPFVLFPRAQTHLIVIPALLLPLHQSLPTLHFAQRQAPRRHRLLAHTHTPRPHTLRLGLTRHPRQKRLLSRPIDRRVIPKHPPLALRLHAYTDSTAAPNTLVLLELLLKHHPVGTRPAHMYSPKLTHTHTLLPPHPHLHPYPHSDPLPLPQQLLHPQNLRPQPLPLPPERIMLLPQRLLLLQHRRIQTPQVPLFTIQTILTTILTTVLATIVTRPLCARTLDSERPGQKRTRNPRDPATSPHRHLHVFNQSHRLP